jgi:hypothetical protein
VSASAWVLSNQRAGAGEVIMLRFTVRYVRYALSMLAGVGHGVSTN